MTSQKTDNGHWKHHRQLDASAFHGFIYLITNRLSGRAYIGKKNFWSVTTLPPLKGKKRRRKKVTEMDWRNYTGSSVEVNESINKNGKENFDFDIILECRTKGELTYAEANLMHSLNVLTDKLPDNKTNRYYNKQIGAIKFLPAFPVREETRNKLRKKRLNIEQVTCEHCGNTYAKPNWARWHGGNCKEKRVDGGVLKELNSGERSY